jgi:hypothetical protein
MAVGREDEYPGIGEGPARPEGLGRVRRKAESDPGSISGGLSTLHRVPAFTPAFTRKDR